MMTAETEVRSEVSEVSSKGEIGMSSSDHLPKVGGADCNSSTNQVNDADVNHDANAIFMDDPDNSYVFVTGKGHTGGDPIDTDLNLESNVVGAQIGEFNVANGQVVPSSGEHKSYIVKGTNVSPEGVDGVQVLAATDPVQEPPHTVDFELEQGGVGGLKVPIESDLTPYPEENQESQSGVLDSVGELGESRKSGIMSPGAGGFSDAQLKSLEQIDVEQIENSGERKEFQNVVFEAPQCQSPEVKFGEVKSEGQNELESAGELQGSVESETSVRTAAEHESCQIVNGKGNVEEERNTDLDIIDVKQNQESQVLVTDDILQPNNWDQVHAPTKSATETDSPLETKTKSDAVSDENIDILPAASYVKDCVSETQHLNEAIYGSQNAPEPNGSSENFENFPCPTDCVRLQSNGNVPVEIVEIFAAGSDDGTTIEQDAASKDSLVIENMPTSGSGVTEPETQVENSDVTSSENIMSCAVDNPKSDIAAENVPVEDESMLNYPADYVLSQPEIGIASIDPEENVPAFHGDEVHVVSQVLNGDVMYVHSQSISDNSLDTECHVSDKVENGSDTDDKFDSEVDNSSAIPSSNMPSNVAVVSGSEVLDGSGATGGDALSCAPVIVDVAYGGNQFDVTGEGSDGKLICEETKDNESLPMEGKSTSLPEGSSYDGMDRHNVGAEDMIRPFRYLSRMPRFDDEKLEEQITQAEQQIREKTHHRAAFRAEIENRRASYRVHQDDCKAATSEEKNSRRLVREKRQEIDSVQSKINRVKNAISVGDIDARIYNMEHMIEHETMPLKEEKQFIREIKQLKHLREQLSSNMGSQDEVQQALDDKDKIEEHLKTLKKELDGLKDRVAKADVAAVAAVKKRDDDSKKLKELDVEFNAANKIRQEAYKHLLSLRSQLNKKKNPFWEYKSAAMAASNCGSRGDHEGLHRICSNQVETVFELYKIAEFRKEYARCNMRSTLRRFGTLDGRGLGPDEEPTLLPSYVRERVDRLVSGPAKANSVSQIPTLEQEKQASPVEGKVADGKLITKVAEYGHQTAKTKKYANSNFPNGSAAVSGRDEAEEKAREEEHRQTKEEQELAKKAEELRKEVAAAKLKEHRRLEEKAKAKEALERKKRNAEKAQIRAELRAQKEAEQKEKEREKKLKKKERKKAAAVDAPDCNTDGEIGPTPETSTGTFKEPEIKESHSTLTTRPSKSSQFIKQTKTKSIPPPLRNRGKRKLQQWMWAILVVLLLIAVFLLGNMGIYSTLKLRAPRF